MDPTRFNVITFRDDTTLRWSCREGDYLLWLHIPGLDDSLSTAPTQQLRVADMWQLKDGDHVILTNRFVDLPPWFELHPTEAQGRTCTLIMEKLNAGWKPGERTEGPNIWRVRAGDRIVWVSLRQHPELAGAAGVLAVVDFRENALVAGEPGSLNRDLADFIAWGAPTDTPDAIALCRKGVEAGYSIGPPRTVATDWGI